MHHVGTQRLSVKAVLVCYVYAREKERVPFPSRTPRLSTSCGGPHPGMRGQTFLGCHGHPHLPLDSRHLPWVPASQGVTSECFPPLPSPETVPTPFWSFLSLSSPCPTEPSGSRPW